MKFQPDRPGRHWHRHPYGQSVRLGEHFYVPIPKCASSWCTEIWGQGQPFDFLAHEHDLDAVVILRDPIERWIAGFAQCQVGNDPNWEGHWERLGWDWVFDTVVFDNHTEPQVSFLAGIDFDRTTWFRMDDHLTVHMLSWMQTHLGQDRSRVAADRYAGHEQPARVFRDGMRGRSQAEIADMAQQALAIIPGAVDRIRAFYKEDLDLYYTVEYCQGGRACGT